MKLKLENISRSFGAVKALQGIDFELHEGEVHAICGENGAGKSTLMNILSGNLQPDSGKIWLNDMEIQLKNQNHATESGIAIVHQHLSLFENRTVAENIFVNQFPINKLGMIDFEQIDKNAEFLLKSLKINELIRPDQLVAHLSAAQKQMVEIAKSLAKKSSILILDEPTASISGNDVKTLFGIIRKLKAEGTSIIYISHRMEEIFQIADRVTVLKDGRYIATKSAGTLTKEALISLMVGREIAKIKKHELDTNQIILEVRQLSNQKIKDVSFKIHSGEIVALAGLVGAGRTEIAKTIFGTMTRDRGEILVNNEPVIINSTADAIRNRIAYVPEERKSLGLFTEMSILDNINSVGIYQNKSWIYDKNSAVSQARKFKEKLRIIASDVEQKVSDLSGGNQQKVVLAKWLSTNPLCLIIDEPTHGIDVGAKYEIYEILQQLISEGNGVLLISSELQEVLTISDRILVVKNGRIVKELITGKTTEEEILHWAV